MANKQRKSQKMVEKAVVAFRVAVEKIEQANDLLKTSIEEDKQDIDRTDIQIESLRELNNERSEGILEKVKEMEENQKLIEKLEAFAK